MLFICLIQTHAVTWETQCDSDCFVCSKSVSEIHFLICACRAAKELNMTATCYMYEKGCQMRKWQAPRLDAVLLTCIAASQLRMKTFEQPIHVWRWGNVVLCHYFHSFFETVNKQLSLALFCAKKGLTIQILTCFMSKWNALDSHTYVSFCACHPCIHDCHAVYEHCLKSFVLLLKRAEFWLVLL